MQLYDYLQRIPSLARLEPGELRGMAGKARIVCVPAGRCLVQRRQRQLGYLFLLKGRLEVDRRCVKARGHGTLDHFFPGCDHARTLSTCYLMRVDAAHYEFLISKDPALAAAHNSVQSNAEWLAAFLNSQMMRHLTRHQWRDLLSAFKRREYAAASIIIEQGQRGDVCYVLESGAARVMRDGQLVHRLQAGDFFGEDALVLNALRNARVQAVKPVIAHAIDGATFKRVVLAHLVQRVRRRSRGVCLNVGADCIAGAVPITLATLREQSVRFDPRQDYYVVGGRQRQRDLAAFLLVQRGVNAMSLEG
ncbi:MAG: cyclic nucleotide-binding domain-containing protein [Pseudomonadota bacterium]